MELYDPALAALLQTSSSEELEDCPTDELTLKELMDVTFPDEKENLPDIKSNSGIPLYPDYFDIVKDRMQDMNGTDGKMKKLIIQEGFGEDVPEKFEIYAKCLSYFKGKNLPFDSFNLENTTPRACRMQKTIFTKGLKLAFDSMKRQEIALFFIHPDYANTDVNSNLIPKIPPNTSMIILVHLRDFIDNEIIESWLKSGILMQVDLTDILKDKNCRPALRDMLQLHKLCHLKRKLFELENQMQSEMLTPDDEDDIEELYCTYQSEMVDEYMRGGKIKFSMPMDITLDTLDDFENQELRKLIIYINRIRSGEIKIESTNTWYTPSRRKSLRTRSQRPSRSRGFDSS